ncbi:MAG: ABC transporter permease [Candidatus Obscuribacterales bacterium]|nr:ABC transporter permease [Candidatus Obscuribacterales bacterium]
MKLLFLYPLPLIIFIAIWHFLTVGQPDRQFIFSSPSQVLNTCFSLLKSGELVHQTGVTVFEALCGFIFGTVIGSFLGLSMWYSRTVAKIAKPYITAIATIPIFALAPIIIVWFGIGILSKVMLAFLSTVTVSIVQSYQGAMSVEPRFLRLMKVVGASRWQTFKHVVIPSSLIWVINAMKLSIGLALLGAFIGEFISAEEGLGYMIVKASGLYDMSTVLTGVIALAAIALFLTGIVDQIEKRLLKQ